MARKRGDETLSHDNARSHATPPPVSATVDRPSSPGPGVGGEPNLVGSDLLQFRVVARIGAGGMGVVYKAIDTKLRRTVALKVLGERYAADQRNARMLLREAQSAAAINDPTIAAIYDVCTVGALTFIVMEFVQGHTLREHLHRGGLAWRDACALARRIAAGLARAHEAGIVHRDLKPDNVMVTRDGQVKMLDFGLAKWTFAGEPAGNAAPDDHRSIALGGRIVGTPAYMPPEQARGDAIDARVDVFALGVVLFELLTGASPFPALARSVVGRTPEHYAMRSVRELRPDVPAAVAACIARALAYERTERYASAGELGAALEAAAGAEGLGASARLAPIDVNAATELRTAADTASPRLSRVRRPRWPFVVAAAGVGVLALTIGVTPRLTKPKPAAAGAEAAAPVSECTVPRDCAPAMGGAPATCHKGKCAALASEDCRVLADRDAREATDTVWFGTLFPMTGPDGQEYGTSNVQAADLARGDFARATTGLGTGDPSLRVHPFGILACDATTNWPRATRHLVEDVGAPAIIGFHSLQQLVELANRSFVPARTLAISALNTSALVTAIPQPASEPRLIWRTTYSTALAAPAIAALVSERLEPRARRLLPRASTRVAVVRSRAPTTTAFADALTRVLVFNGKPALDNGGDYVEVTLADTDPNYAAAVDALVASHPDIVVFFAPGPVIPKLFAPLEERWNEGRPRPVYIAPTVLASDVYGFVRDSAERRERIFGLSTVSLRPANLRFVMHYNEMFPDRISPTVAPNTTYDAVYVLGYALAVLGADAVSGPALARAFERFSGGRRVPIGEASILEAMSILRAGGSIDLEGATGDLDFDPKTGEAPFDLALLCVNGDARATVESGLVFDAATRKLRGEVRCP